MADVTITCRPNGPFLVSGPARVLDHEGNEFNLTGKETFALCRCGQSANRPFCDGTHKTCGFEATEPAR
ncbi:MAG: CDGSH iron-sulfur domain-containing protein [Planctomycetota bacterium]|nr:MAG: CDGSH iron-sulfur domain-containing protein [Planctomycetota bacterium]REK29037.1 MAG: CDGSH iron-sulfur domain-containing protein [Planctomycetota bacterium]REK39717.1 MAG: CDGSH iron-sulfur domain-containing protein [Planctomycetota bacterium]